MSQTSVLKDLIQTAEDGHEGFSAGAEKLDKDGATAIANAFRELSEQRARFVSELQDCATTDGEEIKESGSAAGSLHRGWMALKDALAGSSPSGVLDAAEQGEDHAKREYQKALESDALSPSTRTVVSRQHDEVVAAHDRVRTLRDVTAE